MKLYRFFSETVNLTDCDGKIWFGKVAAYTSKLDSETGEEEIAIRTKDGRLIGFTKSEIKEITITD